MGQFFAENGTLPLNIATGSAQPVTNGGNGDICNDLVPNYLAEMAVDPLPGSSFSYTDCSNYDSGYTITRNAANRVTVEAPNSEDPDGGPTGPVIKITR